ncbi:MAG: hypothetical protein FWG66_13025 [Spirochaetes bacterium]|nr:hypothetical protein [Spirochaetota bacterium]
MNRWAGGFTIRPRFSCHNIEETRANQRFAVPLRHFREAAATCGRRLRLAGLLPGAGL